MVLNYFITNNRVVQLWRLPRIQNFLVQTVVLKKKPWEKTLHMGKPVTKSLCVCSKHFTNDTYCSKGKNVIHIIDEQFSKKKLCDFVFPYAEA